MEIVMGLIIAVLVITLIVSNKQNKQSLLAEKVLKESALRKAKKYKQEKESALYDLDKVVHAVEGRIEKELTTRLHEVNQTAKWLDEQIAIVLMHKKMSEQAFKEGKDMANWANEEIYKVQQLKKDLHQLRNDSHQAIKENKHQLFEVKEASLWLYNHYKRVCEILGSAITDEISFAELQSLLMTASNNMNVVGQKFFKDFRQTPDQYEQQKISATGRKENGEEESISGFSKN